MDGSDAANGRRGGRRIAALSFGLLLAIVGILLAEVTCRCLPETAAPPRRWLHGQPHRELIRLSEAVGYELVPERSMQATLVSDGKIIYDHGIRIDERGRRFTPQSAPDRRGRHLATLGCSFAFGEGNEDSETLASRLAMLLPDRLCSNLGCFGYGLQHVVATVLDGRVVGSSDPPAGTLVYLFIDGHLRRLSGTPRCAELQVYRSSPTWRLTADGELERGRFDALHPWRLLFLRTCRASHLIRRTGWRPAFDETEETFALAEALLRMARDAYVGGRKDRRFVLLLYPGSHLGRQLARRFSPDELEVVDLVELFNPRDERHHILGDGHPNALALNEVAVALAPRIGEDRVATPLPSRTETKGSPPHVGS